MIPVLTISKLRRIVVSRRCSPWHRSKHPLTSPDYKDRIIYVYYSSIFADTRTEACHVNDLGLSSSKMRTFQMDMCTFAPRDDVTPVLTGHRRAHIIDLFSAFHSTTSRRQIRCIHLCLVRYRGSRLFYMSPATDDILEGTPISIFWASEQLPGKRPELINQQFSFDLARTSQTIT
jgi:hypothetical protein